MPRNLRATAAWRISIWTTLAFALGTAGAFYIVYFLVAQGIRERSDTWLSGEAEVLVQVLADTPRDHLHKRIIGEVAELATREVPDERNSRGDRHKTEERFTWAFQIVGQNICCTFWHDVFSWSGAACSCWVL
jgi:hypothetical protein